MISWRKCKDICKDISLSIFINFTFFIQIIFWIAIGCDNGRVFESLYKNSTYTYEPIMKNKLGVSRLIGYPNADCNFKIPALFPIITINVCLIIFTLMPKSSLKYWKWACDKAFLFFIYHIVITPVSSLHLLFNIFFLCLILVVSVWRWRFRTRYTPG